MLLTWQTFQKAFESLKFILVPGPTLKVHSALDFNSNPDVCKKVRSHVARSHT
jgi:hypothetical protein